MTIGSSVPKTSRNTEGAGHFWLHCLDGGGKDDLSRLDVTRISCALADVSKQALARIEPDIDRMLPSRHLLLSTCGARVTSGNACEQHWADTTALRTAVVQWFFEFRHTEGTVICTSGNKTNPDPKLGDNALVLQEPEGPHCESHHQSPPQGLCKELLAALDPGSYPHGRKSR